jgi:hypothetical protein
MAGSGNSRFAQMESPAGGRTGTVVNPRMFGAGTGQKAREVSGRW